MYRDVQRANRVQRALRESGLDALVCALPLNVLMLTGYWPVVGASVALTVRDGPTLLLVPKDELDLACLGWADTVSTFAPGSLRDLRGSVEALRRPLGTAALRLGIGRGIIGYESRGVFEPATYASMHFFGESLRQLLGEVFPSARLTSADTLLASLRSIKTAHELERIRAACQVAREAFERGFTQLRPGLSEAEIAHLFEGPLSIEGLRLPATARAGGFVFCMSGANSAEAGSAYARTRARQVQRGDLVLVHCNSYIDGHWTDITRTYCLGPVNEKQAKMYAAVLAARAAALDVIRPGTPASDVDKAARTVLAENGFGEQFTHPVGHGVGFAAINSDAHPRLHPLSAETLAEGMVFNVEPAVYISGFGGLRHCDMVTVTGTGAEVLTPFQATTGAVHYREQ
jgi:Xaa-Pro aminopeptidase